MHDKLKIRRSFKLSDACEQDYLDIPKDTAEAAVAFYTERRAAHTTPLDLDTYAPTNFDELKHYIQIQNDYIQTQNGHIREQIRSNKEKIEPISKQPANTGMTICVPVAIRHETPETIERLMEQLTAASTDVEMASMWLFGRTPKPHPPKNNLRKNSTGRYTTACDSN